MYIARILYPVKTLGPGKRLGIWFCGCEHHCKGCSNPELWEQPESSKITTQSLMKVINRLAGEYSIDGFTLSGGDPFYQPDALRELLPELSKISSDVFIYTGYLYDELLRKYSGLLQQIAVLIDGPYIEALNSGEALRGSSNQNIIFLRREFQHVYDDYCNAWRNHVQNFTTSTGVASVGIHRPGYHQELQTHLKKRGLQHVDK